MSRADMHIAIITNMLAPYRVPLFRALAAQPGVTRLSVLVCVDKESDRQWTVDTDDSFKVVRLRGHTIERSAGGDRLRIIHLRWEVMSWLLRERPDRIIIGDASWTSYLAGLACRLGRLKYWVWSEITPASKTHEGLTAKLRRWMYRGAQACLAASQEAKRYLMLQGVPASQIKQVTNAIDVDAIQNAVARWRPQSKALQQALGVRPGAFVFLYVGQLITRKRVLETMAQLERVAQHHQVHLVVAGSGPQEGELRQQAAQCAHLGTSFVGYVEGDALWKLYACADVLVLMSDDEPWGMVISEALACGLPFVASPQVAAAVEFEELGWIADTEAECDSQILALMAAVKNQRVTALPTPYTWACAVKAGIKC